MKKQMVIKSISCLSVISAIALSIHLNVAKPASVSRVIASQEALQTQADTIQNYQKIANGIFEAGVRCPERIWSKFDLSGVDLYLVNNATKTAWHSKLDKKQPSAMLDGVSYQKIPEVCKKMQSGGFKFEKTSSLFSSDKIAMCLEVNDKELSSGWPIQANNFAGDLIEKGIHESFHFVYGQNWPRANKLPTDRYIYYPAVSSPRVFRNELVKSLVLAFTDPSHREEHLRASAYWNEQYERADPKEFQNTKWVDIIEGSAKYVGIIGWAIAENGCKVSEQDLNAYLRKKMVIPDISERPMASMESYSLGLVASLLLREMSTPNFQYEIQMGSTPATTLLKGIQSTPTPTDPVRQAQVEQGISTSNSEFGLKIDPYLSNMNNRDYTAVSIPWDDHVGSYNPGAFIKVESYPQAIIMPTFGAVFENSGKGMSVRSKDNAVALVDNSCGKQQVVFLIRKSDVITNPEGISINLPTLQIRATKDDRKADPFFKEVLLCL